MDGLTSLDDQSKCYNPQCNSVEDCNVKRFMICSKCRSVKYYSKECQVLDWKEHKKQCQKMLADRDAIIQKNRTMIQRIKRGDTVNDDVTDEPRVEIMRTKPRPKRYGCADGV